MRHKKQVQKPYRRRLKDREVERLRNIITRLKGRLERMSSRKTKKTAARRKTEGEVMTAKLELSNAQDEIASLEYKLARAENHAAAYKKGWDAEKLISKAAFAGQKTAQGHADKLRRALYLAAVVNIALGAALGVVANT